MEIQQIGGENQLAIGRELRGSCRSLLARRDWKAAEMEISNGLYLYNFTAPLSKTHQKNGRTPAGPSLSPASSSAREPGDIVRKMMDPAGSNHLGSPPDLLEEFKGNGSESK